MRAYLNLQNRKAAVKQVEQRARRTQRELSRKGRNSMEIIVLLLLLFFYRHVCC